MQVFWLNTTRATALYFFLACLAFLPETAFANPAPDRLSNPAHVATFYAVTRRLNCQCSCHGLLGECPHIDENCFGVQTRRFVETRVLEGMSENEIVDGFVSGFGEGVRKDRQLEFLAARGREDLVEGYVRGFGRSILHISPSPIVPVFALIFGVLIFVGIVFIMFYGRRGSRSSVVSVSSDESTSDWERRVRRSIDDLER